MMNFQEVEYRLSGLSEQVRNGQITREQYSAAVNQLRVVDASGKTWQPNPGGSGWLFWDGATWRQGNPPDQTPVPTVGEVSTPRSISEFRDQLIDYKTFRKISKEVPLAKRPQKWWDFFSIVGGVVGAIIWIIYSKENLDFITPILMIALPVILVWFRKDIDNLLLPFQPTRKKIPMMLLVGIGIALPFLTAFILYNVFNFSEYSLIRANLIIGVLGAYILVRNPVLAQATHQIPGRGRPAFLLMVFCLLFIVAPVLADDCLRDPTRAEDCLRTPGFAEIIAGTAAAGLSILVNGPIIIQTVAAGAAGSGADGSGGKPGGSGKIYGTGTPDDPYRDDGAIGKVGPDGTITPYPEAAGQPPKIYGDGSRQNPYSDSGPPVFDHTPTPPDVPPQPPTTSPPVSPPATPPQVSSPQTGPGTIPEKGPDWAPLPPITSPPGSPPTSSPTSPAEPVTPTGPSPPNGPTPPVGPVTPGPVVPPTGTPGPTGKEGSTSGGEEGDGGTTVIDHVGQKAGTVSETAETVKNNVEDLNDKLGKVKDFVDDNNIHNFSDETKQKVKNLQDKVKACSDEMNDFLDKAKENADYIKENYDKYQEIKKNLSEIHKNAEEVNNAIKDVPMDPKSRAVVSLGVAGVDAVGRGFDKVVRNTLGDKVADAVGAKDLGKETGKAADKVIHDVTKTNRDIADEALSGDKTAQDIMGQDDFQKLKDQRNTQDAINKAKSEQAANDLAKQKQIESYR